MVAAQAAARGGGSDEAVGMAKRQQPLSEWRHGWVSLFRQGHGGSHAVSVFL
jgi:hypothetical protein